MGTYHSYVGDAKLEDSKDNWYRISGMTVDRFNLHNENTASRNNWELRHNDIGYNSSNKSILTSAYLKILNGGSYPVTQDYGLWSMVCQEGSSFNIKDRNNISISSIASDNIIDRAELSKTVYRSKPDQGQTSLMGKSLLTLSTGASGEIMVFGCNLNGNTHFRPMLTLKPVDPGITNPIILSCRINAKLIDRNYGPNNQRFGWDRTIKFDPLYSAYSIKQTELVLNVDTKGNSTGNGIGAAVVIAGIVPPKNDETICIEYRTQEAVESSNSYTLKVTFNNNKVLYIPDALVTTGASPLAQDKTQTRIYRMSDLV